METLPCQSVDELSLLSGECRGEFTTGLGACPSTPTTTRPFDYSSN